MGRPPRRSRRAGGRVIRWVLLPVAALALAVTLASQGYVAATDREWSATPPSEGHYVETDGVRTHYETWGASGSPVVLVPGFAESTYIWHAAAPLLARTHRVYAYDVRGYGYTDHRGPYTLDADTAQLAAFLRVLHLDAAHQARPFLVGHSLGAAVVANLARVDPQAAAGIVLLDGDATPNGAGPLWVHRLVTTRPFFAAALRIVLSSDWALRRIIGSACGPACPTDPSALAAWRGPYRMPGAQEAARTMARAPLIGLTPAQLETVRVPTAVMAGDLDPQMSPAAMATTASWLHTTITYRLPGARHLLMLSDPAGFSRGLEGLLHRLTEASGHH